MEQLLKDAIEVLRLVSLDCQGALNDEWDRSDDGFVAMQENAEEMIARYDVLMNPTCENAGHAYACTGVWKCTRCGQTEADTFDGRPL